MTNPVPTSLAVVLTLMRVTWRRLLRGRALWVTALIALLPTARATLIPTNDIKDTELSIALVTMVVMNLLPCVFVAASIGEEIEDRTTTYLWSRPLARWTVVVSKLAALAPVAALMVIGGWMVALAAGPGTLPTGQGLLAFSAGTLAVACTAAGIATLLPRHGMAISIVYMVLLDGILAAIPASLRQITITWQVVLLAGLDERESVAAGVVTPTVTLAVIAGIWLAIALLRVRRLES